MQNLRKAIDDDVTSFDRSQIPIMTCRAMIMVIVDSY